MSSLSQSIIVESSNIQYTMMHLYNSNFGKESSQIGAPIKWNLSEMFIMEITYPQQKMHY